MGCRGWEWGKQKGFFLVFDGIFFEGNEIFILGEMECSDG